MILIIATFLILFSLWIFLSLSSKNQQSKIIPANATQPGLKRTCENDSDCIGTRTCKCIRNGEICENANEGDYELKYECVCYQGICNTNSLIPCEKGCLDSEYCKDGFCRDYPKKISGGNNSGDDCCTPEQKAKGYTCIVQNCPGPPVGPGREYMGSTMSDCIFPGNSTYPGDPRPVCPT